jgi:cell division protease FtsH
MSEQNNNLKNKNKGAKGSSGGFNFFWIYGIIAVVLISLNLFTASKPTDEISSDKFLTNVAPKGHVDKLIIVNESEARVTIKKDSLKYYFKDPKKEASENGPHLTFNIGNSQVFYSQLSDLQKELRHKDTLIQLEKPGSVERFSFETTSTKETNMTSEILGWLIPIVLLIAFWIFLMRRMGGGAGGGGQIFNIGKSKAQLFDKEKSTNITFNDVAGLEGAKEEIQEIVDFLKNPKKYTELGAKIPKGALLVGPPGTGKTLLAKAVAGEAQVPFFSLSGSDFVEMFVGVGASRVRDLFRQAKEKAPCIIFIDEIDAIGRARGKSPSLGSNDERENTLNQLLTEMDGFGTNSGVIILAATNRADILDRALMRPGRFDRTIYVDLPDLNERKKIFAVHLRPLKVAEGLDIDFLSRQTPGFSGADIANICNEAALIAARKKKKAVEKQDFLDAVDRVIGGLEKKNKIVSTEEKKVIAYHEAGHASISWLLEHASPLIKVTIVPRGQSLGAAWYLPEERQITRTEQLLDEMCATLGGRAAEKVMFDKISTGALSDLERVTKMSYAMVSIYGLNDKLGNISYYDPQGSEFAFSKPYSESRAELIDLEVSKIIEGQFERAVRLLEENKDKLSKLAELLLEKEVIFKEDLESIFGKRTFAKDLEQEKQEQLEKDKKEKEKSNPDILQQYEENKNKTEQNPSDSTLFGNTFEWDNDKKPDNPEDKKD